MKFLGFVILTVMFSSFASAADFGQAANCVREAIAGQPDLGPATIKFSRAEAIQLCSGGADFGEAANCVQEALVGQPNIGPATDKYTRAEAIVLCAGK